MNQVFAQNLIDFIYESPTAYQGVATTKRMLKEAGFTELTMSDKWELNKSKGYFVSQNDSAIFAFHTPKELTDISFKISCGHIDSPNLKLKPAPEITGEGYLKLNVEVYGGPILSTWFDRPLSLAGRVLVKSKDPFKPKTMLLNVNEPIFIIPNLAIHMNREVNNGIAIDNQKVLLPMVKTISDRFEDKNYVNTLIAEKLGVKPDMILDFDLSLYEYEKGRIVGVDSDFISTSRIDNLQSVFTGIESIIKADHSPDSLNIVSCFDNEEVGSTTKQGANSQLLSNLIERILMGLGVENSREAFLRGISKSFMISVDGAHAVHPNYTEKSDPVNKPIINDGPVVKISANQKYTSDAESHAIIKSIADDAKVKLQIFVNHSNAKGGSTIGPLSSSHLEMKSVDIGVPMLAMHSIRELCGVDDNADMIKLITKFFEI